jgi:hypothetical protein
MYATAIMKPVRAVMTLAMSTVTFMAICAFMEISPFGAVSQRCSTTVNPWPCFDGYWVSRRVAMREHCAYLNSLAT